MSALRVILSPQSRIHLENIYLYIASEASPAIARNYVDAIVGKCESLADFPRRGTQRGDLRPGMRTIVHRARVTIAYDVGPDTVTIHGVFYAGQDFEAILRED